MSAAHAPLEIKAIAATPANKTFFMGPPGDQIFFSDPRSVYKELTKMSVAELTHYPKKTHFVPFPTGEVPLQRSPKATVRAPDARLASV